MPDKLREKRNKFTEKFLRLPRMKAAFEDAWYLHGRMFGPIMEPAFVGEIAARFPACLGTEPYKPRRGVHGHEETRPAV